MRETEAQQEAAVLDAKGSTLAMGIDIEIYIRTEPTPDLMNRLRALSKERDEDGDCKYWVIESVRACTCYDEKPPHVHISSCSRYFGKYYPRGYWPKIRESLLVLRAVCPEGTQIEYGSDSSDLDSGIPVDDAMLAEFDAEWIACGKAALSTQDE